jgi:hypothetical protein
MSSTEELWEAYRDLGGAVASLHYAGLDGFADRVQALQVEVMGIIDSKE